MKANMTKPESKQDNDVRDIPKWTRRYAQNRRSLPSILGILLILAAIAVMMLPTLLLQGTTYYRLALVAGMLAGVGCIALCIWFIFVRLRRGQSLPSIELAITRWLYRSEGNVGSVTDNAVRRSPRWVAWLGIIVVLAPLSLLPEWESLPSQYWQPLAAILWVPYLTYLILRPPQGVDSSHPIVLLWPGLYACHAILILAGVPLYITGPYEGLTMWASLGVCALIAALAAHFYSRYALRRLRTLAQSPHTTGGGQR